MRFRIITNNVRANPCLQVSEVQIFLNLTTLIHHMFSVALIHSGKSFMPEIEAYQKFFEHAGIKASILIHPVQSEMETYDVLWFFMGVQYYLNKINKKKVLVHEYCSASTPPLPRLKDFIKKIINSKPALRVTLAKEHNGVVFPADNIPLIVREQGVHECFFKKILCDKEYDFIYTGSAVKIRKTDKWLHGFATRFPGKIIVLVGNHEARIKDQFRSNQFIQFRRAVPITDLPLLLAKARFAVNYVPDVYPFNIQPSTKLLEYYAAGCNVISNSYEWVNRFNREKQAGLFFIDDRFEYFNDQALTNFQFTLKDMKEYSWGRIFEEMELMKVLQLKFL